MSMYIRLKPYQPRAGFQRERLHFQGTLFQGGMRPTWYLVDDGFANQVRDMKQDSGALMFDVVDPDTKTKIDQEETARHMAALGLPAANVAAPMAAPVNLTSPGDGTRGRRAAAIPAVGGDVSSADFNLTPAAPPPPSAAPPPPPPPLPESGNS